MAAVNIPKWQKEVLQILWDQYQGDELEELLKKTQELINLVQEIEVPSGEIGKVVALLLHNARWELDPLRAVYAGFQLGVAWERYQNANGA